VVFCLVLFGVAARRVPHLEEQMAHECEPALGPQIVVTPSKTMTAGPLPWPAHRSPAVHAKITASTLSLAAPGIDHHPAAREIAVLDAA